MAAESSPFALQYHHCALSPSPFKASAERQDGVWVVQVVGELDMGTAPQLEAEIERAPGDEEPLLVDLSGCEFIDSTGIALIVRAWQQRERNDAFALCGVADQVGRVLEITGLETIPSHASREDALARFA